MAPQNCERDEPVTSFMRAAPTPNDDTMHEEEDQRVADPLSEETNRLWNETARVNREVFTDIFKPVPSNSVRNWQQYAVRMFLFLRKRSTDCHAMGAGICAED
jgi:phospholipase D1/2